MDLMDEFFHEKSEKILVYTAIETQADPYEKNVILNFNNPYPIDAIVNDLSFNQLQWKMPGIETNRAKEIIVDKKRKDLIEQSHKIEIDNDDYEGWKLNSKLQYREEGKYIRAYIYKKEV